MIQFDEDKFKWVETTSYTLMIQSPCQIMIGVYNHLLRNVFRFHERFSEGDWIPRDINSFYEGVSNTLTFEVRHQVIKSSSDVLRNYHKRKIIFHTITIVFRVVLQGEPSSFSEKKTKSS